MLTMNIHTTDYLLYPNSNKTFKLLVHVTLISVYYYVMKSKHRLIINRNLFIIIILVLCAFYVKYC